MSERTPGAQPNPSSLAFPTTVRCEITDLLHEKLAFSFLATLANISFGGKTTLLDVEYTVKRDVQKPLIIVDSTPLTRVALMYIEK